MTGADFAVRLPVDSQDELGELARKKMPFLTVQSKNI
jgi:hypothetical protein